MAIDINKELLKYGILPEGLDWADTDQLFNDHRKQIESGMIPFSFSSNVAAVRYDHQKGLLYVLFDNHREKAGPRLYTYFGLGELEPVYDQLFGAASPGAVVWDLLRRPGVGFEKMG